MSCAAFTLLGLIASVLKKTSTWMLWVTFGLAIVFLLLASFLAWRDQYHRANDAAAKLAELTLPKLDGEFSVVSARAGNEGQDCLLTLVGIIRNVGAPTILDHWSANLVFDDGTAIHGERISPPPPETTVRLFVASGKYAQLLFGKNHWSTIGTEKPIPTGGGVPGWIQFYLKGVTQDRMNVSHAKVVLSFQDVNGRQWSVSRVLERANPEWAPIPADSIPQPPFHKPKGDGKA